MPLLTHFIAARRPGFRIAVMAVLVATGLLVVTGSHASDRDTPAYRIYVDPVTGRYSTKSPDERAAATPQGNITQPAATPPAATSNNGNEANLRRPLTAALLLVVVAAASLLTRTKQSS